MIALPSFLLAAAGLGSLSLSMHRHAGQAGVAQRLLPRQTQVRAAGWALFLLSLTIRITHGRWHLELVEWIAQAGLAAGCVTLTLLYRPRWLPFVILGTMVPGLLLIFAD